ncbi:UPF0149 family protein [Idiomarina sp. HP20-50]|uniref:UPF0149 family protein n=1 Tax=Idiomarina sp. HP20-50 TaxID=3070813 RepID=UPI00294B7443|nr:UPF0149 family protein [Idiomarina sp. HP20-50]MDV6315708.1 UPF0149 family protein [Idiomarina sp. HP20-50]
MSTRFNYDRLVELYAQYDMTPSASEVQGMLTGLLATGSDAKSEDLMTLMSDLAYDGQGIPVELKNLLQQQAEEIEHSLGDEDLGYRLLLPDDNTPLSERLNALAGWVNAFLVGYGVNQENMTNLSGDLKEAIEDMVELAKIEFTDDGDEEEERAYFEIVEYLRISAMMCYTELGRKEHPANQPPKTLH